MADVIKKVAGSCDIHDYRQSVNTPDFPTIDWLINPDLSGVAGVPQIHWKVVGSSVLEKTAPEKQATDECLLSPTIVLDTIIGADSSTSEQIAFVVDDLTRSGKELSVEALDYAFSASGTTADLDWLGTILPTDADAGYIMPYNGTVVRATINTVEANSTDQDYNLVVNGTPVGAILNMAGVGLQTAENTLIDFDFAAGDKIRVRASTNSGTVGHVDVTLVITVKWRRA